MILKGYEHVESNYTKTQEHKVSHLENHHQTEKIMEIDWWTLQVIKEFGLNIFVSVNNYIMKNLDVFQERYDANNHESQAGCFRGAEVVWEIARLGIKIQ